jgi:hypothetical protein
VIESGGRSRITRRAESAFVVPPCRVSRLGAIATNPAAARLSATVRTQSLSPKISWITITAGPGSGRSG